MSRDLLDRQMTDEETQLLAIYDALRALIASDPAPCVVSNARAALAPIAVAVTDLGLRFEHLVDEGC